MDLISLIIIISIIAKIFKKNKPDKYEDVKRKAKDLGSEVVGELRGSVETRRSTYEQNSQWQKAARENIEKAKRRAQERQRQPVQPQRQPMEENDAARRQVHAARMEAQNTTILQRAQANAEEDIPDETLRSLEESHGHSAHVAPAIHHHPEDIIPDNMLGTVEDLMVKGYDGSLCFERDFVGEAMDMISRFTVPTDVPDFSKKEVS